ncbi:668_t:CDS:1 [Diversispora eburnea]|uniref:668_t:CDS:1 n=1 Tax=Diversispora eburnea TaxID=1213867 RepID=A0A9N8YZA4_9GLOM|nr:668_t:CDS:1 [Diversispora eburnea]
MDIVLFMLNSFGVPIAIILYTHFILDLELKFVIVSVVFLTLPLTAFIFPFITNYFGCRAGHIATFHHFLSLLFQALLLAHNFNVDRLDLIPTCLFSGLGILAVLAFLVLLKNKNSALIISVFTVQSLMFGLFISNHYYATKSILAVWILFIGRCFDENSVFWVTTSTNVDTTASRWYSDFKQIYYERTNGKKRLFIDVTIQCLTSPFHYWDCLVLYSLKDKITALPFVLLHFTTPLILIYTKYIGYGFIGLYLIACSLDYIIRGHER